MLILAGLSPPFPRLQIGKKTRLGLVQAGVLIVRREKRGNIDDARGRPV